MFRNNIYIKIYIILGNYYIYEVTRGYYQLGQFQLKPAYFTRFKKDPIDVKYVVYVEN
jgi:hypothetical protein